MNTDTNKKIVFILGNDIHNGKNKIAVESFKMQLSGNEEVTDFGRFVYTDTGASVCNHVHPLNELVVYLENKSPESPICIDCQTDALYAQLSANLIISGYDEMNPKKRKFGKNMFTPNSWTMDDNTFRITSIDARFLSDKYRKQILAIADPIGAEAIQAALNKATDPQNATSTIIAFARKTRTKTLVGACIAYDQSFNFSRELSFNSLDNVDAVRKYLIKKDFMPLFSDIEEEHRQDRIIEWTETVIECLKDAIAKIMNEFSGKKEDNSFELNSPENRDIYEEKLYDSLGDASLEPKWQNRVPFAVQWLIDIAKSIVLYESRRKKLNKGPVVVMFLEHVFMDIHYNEFMIPGGFIRYFMDYADKYDIGMLEKPKSTYIIVPDKLKTSYFFHIAFHPDTITSLNSPHWMSPNLVGLVMSPNGYFGV